MNHTLKTIPFSSEDSDKLSTLALKKLAVSCFIWFFFNILVLFSASEEFEAQERSFLQQNQKFYLSKRIYTHHPFHLNFPFSKRFWKKMNFSFWELEIEWRCNCDSGDVSASALIYIYYVYGCDFVVDWRVGESTVNSVCFTDNWLEVLDAANLPFNLQHLIYHNLILTFANYLVVTALLLFF